MTILNIPAWPFEPNWASSVTETLEWLTDIMSSPTGSEQRRSLRQEPRRMFEFTTALVGSERTLLDNLLVTYGAQRWYLPLWHDTSLLDAAVMAGATTLPCSDASTSALRAGTIAFLVNDSVYDHELVELSGVSAMGISLSAGTTRAWPAGTRIYPTRIARLTDQPVATKRSDRVVTSEIRFQVIEPAPDMGLEETGLADTYRNFIVINVAPDDSRQLQAGHERLLLDLDNKLSIPMWVDTANRTFTYQQHTWSLVGRTQHAHFEGILHALRGRAIPAWLPTFMDDLHLAGAVSAGATNILVERCGFVLAGGPRPDRQDIMIELDGQCYYRRIVDAAVDSQGREILVLDQALPVAIATADPVRICFMTLMRLNHDSVPIEHQTDNSGISTVLATFRSAPDTRIPETAFNL